MPLARAGVYTARSVKVKRNRQAIGEFSLVEQPCPAGRLPAR